MHRGQGSYGGANYASGGGSYNQAGYISSDSPYGSPKAEGKIRSSQSLMPVTVRQIINAQLQAEDTFTIDGQQLNQISFVGVIMNPQAQTTNFNFQLDDGTGQIDVRIWIDNEESNQPNLAKWSELAYVRVIGHLRAFNNQRSVVAFRVVPVESSNEITHHHLEAIYVHLVNKHGGQAPSNAQQQSATFFHGQQTNYNNNYNGTYGGAPSGGSFTDVQRAVFNAFRVVNPNDETGLSIQTVAQRLGSMYSEAQVRAAVNFLNSEGHLFSTIDEEHFKGTSH